MIFCCFYYKIEGRLKFIKNKGSLKRGKEAKIENDIIGFDLDGTVERSPLGYLNPSVKLPQWLFEIISPLLSIVPPDKKVINKMEEFSRKGERIVVVTARPKSAEARTLRRFARYKVPCDSLHCVGFGKGTKERKFKVILEKEISVYYDKDHRTVAYLKARQINASSLILN